MPNRWLRFAFAGLLYLAVNLARSSRWAADRRVGLLAKSIGVQLGRNVGLERFGGPICELLAAFGLMFVFGGLERVLADDNRRLGHENHVGELHAG